jgi:hypothetical protein
MDNELNLNDDALFDRLVDGELSATERRTLLLSLDSQPEGWRRCALAFLEAQSWREDFGRVAQAADTAQPQPTVTLAECTVTVKSRGKHRTHWWQSSWMTIATGLLLAITLGAVLHDRVLPGRGTVDENLPVAVVKPPMGAGAAGLSPAGDTMTLWVRDDTGQTRPLRVPLVDANSLDRQLGMEFQPGMSDEMRSQLQEKGYDVHSKQRYAPLWLENGRPLVVPVEDTKIVPVSQRVY